MYKNFQRNKQKEIQILCALLRRAVEKENRLAAITRTLIRSNINVKETEFIHNKEENEK